jgi:putative PIN family toxin of toxin-antitoxin system
MKLVLDTNVVLDLLLFADAATPPLRAALHAGAAQWIATGAMREELARVLAYAHLQPRLQREGRSAADVLAEFDRLATPVPVAARAPMVCKDADDQKFIDLALAQRAALLSKDRAVLKLSRRLQRQGVAVAPAWDALHHLEETT